MSVFTIGFLGRYRFSTKMRDYLDSLVSRYCVRERQIRMMIALTTNNEYRLAERVVALKRLRPNLELVAVITRQQERASRNRADFPYRHVLENADRVDVLSRETDFLHIVQLHRHFLATCNLILFNSAGAGEMAAANFRSQLRDAAERPAVRYLEWEWPEPLSEDFEPALALAESIDYIRRNGFRVMSDCLPTELLARWLKSDAAPGSYTHFATLEDIAAIFRLTDSEGRDYLLLKVFAYAYAVRGDWWICSLDSRAGLVANRRFRQFHRMLELIVEARAKGAEIGSYDLLDFDNYDELLRLAAGAPG